MSIVTKTDGTIWSWGAGYSGTTGQNNSAYINSPTQIGALTNWDKVACGFYFSLAIKTDGTLWSWGGNRFISPGAALTSGQLGDNTSIPRSSPIQVGALTTWSSIACGSAHSVAVKNDGTLWTWGRNVYGQLGQNNITLLSSPVQVGALSTWSKIACGREFTMAIKNDGSLWAWGNNSTGQLGLGDRVYRSSPVQIGALTTWSNISCGVNHAILIKNDGTLWTWGSSRYGQLGIGITLTYRSSPVQVGALTTWSISGGGFYNSLVKKTDGTLWVWGKNQFGALGQGNTIDQSSPVQVGALTGWKNIINGQDFVLATSG
jgi:hypothetical protein